MRNLTDRAKWIVTFDTDYETVRMAYDRRGDAFIEAAHVEAFSDCTDVRNVRVHHAGVTYRYSGWRPGMRIGFENPLGVEVWVGYFPEWDH